MATTEIFVASRHIYDLLAADSALAAAVSGIFGDAVDLGVAAPYVVYQNQSAIDIMAGMGAVREMSQLTFLVRAVAAGRSVAPVEAAAQRISAVLHRSTSQTADGTVLSCLREAQGRRFGVDAGAEWSEIWERFQLQVQAN